ncbi:hypothetical protein BpHYR1_006519 [Brachionus plicatilis]|uniref:Uncharacterized protein n=1 Tax=Brachionus plicatilis TaxID=10195 RepID=A0A3M7R857_BRAPC|nr:hypothetical protein BpHYR1_006519 [Brachionus plicatilis]
MEHTLTSILCLLKQTIQVHLETGSEFDLVVGAAECKDNESLVKFDVVDRVETTDEPHEFE